MKRTQLRRLTPLRQISDKRRERLRLYEIEKRLHLAEFPRCQLGPVITAAGFKVKCWRVGRHIHHAKGRVGPLLLDRRHFFSSCNGECHPGWIHTHPKEARKLGLIH